MSYIESVISIFGGIGASLIIWNLCSGLLKKAYFSKEKEK